MALFSKKSAPVSGAAAAASPVATAPSGNQLNGNAVAAPPAAVPPPAAAVPPPAVATANTTSAPGIDATEAKKRRDLSKRVHASLGEIIAVLMRSPQFRAMPLAAIEALVVPALNTGQFLVAEAQSNENGFVAPVGMVLWAKLSPALDQRMSTELDKPVTLTPKDWNSGDNPWIIAMAGDRRVVSAMLKPLQASMKGKSFKFRSKDKDGKEIVATIEPNAQTAGAAA